MEKLIDHEEADQVDEKVDIMEDEQFQVGNNCISWDQWLQLQSVTSDKRVTSTRLLQGPI